MIKINKIMHSKIFIEKLQKEPFGSTNEKTNK